MSGGGLQYFQYIVISFSSKLFYEYQKKKKYCNFIYKHHISFLGKEHLVDRHLLIDISKKTCSRARVGKHNSLL